jgi:hypothetical protein
VISFRIPHLCTGEDEVQLTRKRRRRLTTNTKIDTVFPNRGVAGGWRDVWVDADNLAELRARAVVAERRPVARAERPGVAWRQELAGTPDASVLVQRSAGRKPEHCSRRAGR